MSPANVLPIAPEYGIDSAQYIYLQLPDFRMQKMNKIPAALNSEVFHYRGVAKNYKKAKEFVTWDSGDCGILSGAFSSASFCSALSVVGLTATIH